MLLLKSALSLRSKALQQETQAESFLLHAKDDTIMTAKKNQTERMPAPEMIRLETIKQYRYLLASVMRSRKSHRVISVNDILAETKYK